MAGIDSLFRNPDAEVLVEIIGANGEPLGGEDDPMGIYVTDMETDACKKVIDEHAAEIAKLKRIGKDISPAKNRKFSNDLLVAASVRFTDSMATEDGKPYLYSEKNVRKLYKKSPTVRKQVDAVVGADELFIQGVSQGATSE